MNIKKLATFIAILGLSGAFLAACGAKGDQNTETLEGKEIDYKKDAVDKKNKVVDGKEVTEYTMPDGNVIQIPVDGEEEADTGDSSTEE